MLGDPFPESETEFEEREPPVVRAFYDTHRCGAS